MKKLLYVSLLILTSLSLHAQQLTYGVHAGVNMSTLHSGNSYRVYDSKYKLGYQIGGDVMYTFKNRIVLSSGLDAIIIGGKFSTLSPYYHEGSVATEFPEVNSRELSFEIPLKIGYKFRLGEVSSITPSVGAYCRYSMVSLKDNVTLLTNLNTKETVTEKWNCFKTYTNPNNPNISIPSFNRFDFGLNVGVQAIIAKHYSISASYSQGLKKHSDKYELKNKDFRFSVGYIF